MLEFVIKYYHRPAEGVPCSSAGRWYSEKLSKVLNNEKGYRYHARRGAFSWSFPTTVSLILNQSGSASFSQETVNRVYAAAAQLNYKAKRHITQGPRPKTVMVLMANVTNPYYTVMLSSIEDVCYAQGYKVVSCCTYHDTESEKLYMEMAVSNNYPGVILLSPPDYPAATAG